MNEYYQPLTEDDVKRFSSSLDMSMLSRMIPLKSNIQNQKTSERSPLRGFSYDSVSPRRNVK